MTTESKRRTITLTDRAPVRIVDSEWPRIARGSGHDGEVECQANHQWFINVRQHADGRTIVYGGVIEGLGGMRAGESEHRGGEMLTPGSDLAAAIRRVGDDCGVRDETVRECIASLPAEDL